MPDSLSNGQKAELRRIWAKYEGLDRLADNFIKELAWFLDNCPKLIAESNKKIETKESRDHASVAKHCDKLLKALAEIPVLDRINRLSLREQRSEYSDRIVPLCDPLEYVQALKKLASERSYQLKGYVKYERQLDDLRSFIERFPPLREISRTSFIDLAVTLWPEINQDSIIKAYQSRKK